MPASLLGRRWTLWSKINATLVLLIASGLVAFLGVAVVSNYQAAGNAVTSLNRARELTARRIDLLNTQIDRLSAQNAKAARQRGLLIAEVEALTSQLRALGVSPIIAPQVAPAPAPGSTSTVVTVHPAPRPSGPPRPRPTRTVTRTPRPQPSPTRTCVASVLTLCVH